MGQRLTKGGRRRAPTNSQAEQSAGCRRRPRSPGQSRCLWQKVMYTYRKEGGRGREGRGGREGGEVIGGMEGKGGKEREGRRGKEGKEGRGGEGEERGEGRGGKSKVVR